jgi:hypothetical protein
VVVLLQQRDIAVWALLLEVYHDVDDGREAQVSCFRAKDAADKATCAVCADNIIGLYDMRLAIHSV